MRRSRIGPGVLLSVLELLAPTPALAQGWQTFRPQGGAFSVEMPATPVPSTMETTSFIGTVTDHVYTATLGQAQFAVTWSKLPGYVLDFTPVDALFDHARAALLKQIYGRQVSWGPVEADGRSGRRLVYQLPPVPGKAAATGEARFFLVQDRIYSAAAIVPSQAGEPDAQRFLDSLGID